MISMKKAIKIPKAKIIIAHFQPLKKTAVNNRKSSKEQEPIDLPRKAALSDLMNLEPQKEENKVI